MQKTKWIRSTIYNQNAPVEHTADGIASNSELADAFSRRVHSQPRDGK